MREYALDHRGRFDRRDDLQVIVNSKTEDVLGVVSRSYRLVTNREALEMAAQCCRAVFPETKASEWEVKAADAPATAGYCHIDLVHNSTALDFSFVAATDRPEAFGPFIRVTNSYNGLRALAFDIGYYRKVCRNGLILPGSIIRFKFVHSRRGIGETVNFDIAHDRLAKLKADLGDLFGTLRECKMPRADFGALVSGVLILRPPRQMKSDARNSDEWMKLTAHLLRNRSTLFR